MTWHRALGGLVTLLATSLGLLALLTPFLRPVRPLPALLLSALTGLALLALLLEAQDEAAGAKFVALLGVLVAINSVLRFVETALPGPGGFSPIFFLIILTGYVFGARFGFLMGALTLAVSALVTGGVGPWLPFQMLAAGWAGLSAGILRLPAHRLGLEGRRGEMALLTLTGALWGLAYGALVNLWFWPFALGPTEQVWTPGLGAGETLGRYALFYVTTSLGWDLLRAGGNAALLLLAGAPALRALRRFHRRFAFTYHPLPGSAEEGR